MKKSSKKSVDELSLREGSILNLVVSNFIATESPVSSLFLTSNYDLGLSSATVRAVLVELENKGYLFSPYRSSGRIPSENGYRYYIENMNESSALPEEDKKFIQTEYLKRDFQMENILDATSRILSTLTNSVGIVLGPEPNQTVLKHIELIGLGEDELLIVLVNRSGVVYSRTIHLLSRIPIDILRKISNYLNETFKGCDLTDMRNRLEQESWEENELPEYYQMIIEAMRNNFAAMHGEDKLYSFGVEKLLFQIKEQDEKHPDISTLFSSKNQIKSIFDHSLKVNDVTIQLGGDCSNNLSGLSFVSAPYQMGGKKMGALGVVGPNRMDYQRAVSIVNFMGQVMSGMLTRLSN